MGATPATALLVNDCSKTTTTSTSTIPLQTAEALVIGYDESSTMQRPPLPTIAEIIPVRVVPVHPPRSRGVVGSGKDKATLYPQLRAMKQRQNQHALTTGLVVGAAGVLVGGP